MMRITITIQKFAKDIDGREESQLDATITVYQ